MTLSPPPATQALPAAAYDGGLIYYEKWIAGAAAARPSSPPRVQLQPPTPTARRTVRMRDGSQSMPLLQHSPLDQD